MTELGKMTISPIPPFRPEPGQYVRVQLDLATEPFEARVESVEGDHINLSGVPEWVGSGEQFTVEAIFPVASLARLGPAHMVHALTNEVGDEGYPKVWCGYDVLAVDGDDRNTTSNLVRVSCGDCILAIAADGSRPRTADDYIAAIKASFRTRPVQMVPDIDIDASSERTAEIKSYLSRRYGNDRCRAFFPTTLGSRLCVLDQGHDGAHAVLRPEHRPAASVVVFDPEGRTVATPPMSYMVVDPSEDTIKLHMLLQAAIDGTSVRVSSGAFTGEFIGQVVNVGPGRVGPGMVEVANDEGRRGWFALSLVEMIG